MKWDKKKEDDDSRGWGGGVSESKKVFFLHTNIMAKITIAIIINMCSTLYSIWSNYIESVVMLMKMGCL